MAKRPEIRVVSYLIKPESVHKDVRDLTSDDVIPTKDLTEEQMNNWAKEAAERSGRIMSDYYSRHLDQFELLPDSAESSA